MPKRCAMPKRGVELRSDGARNREKVLQAAAFILRTMGPEASLKAVAKRAGVTRTTIYRNFESRSDLCAAVVDREFDLIRQDLRSQGRLPLRAVMERLVDLVDLCDKLGRSLPFPVESNESACRSENLHALVVESLKLAKLAGDVRGDLTEGDVLLACRMIASGWRLDDEPSRESALAKRLALVMPGLRPH